MHDLSCSCDCAAASNYSLIVKWDMAALIYMPLSQYSRLNNYGSTRNLTITQPNHHAAFVTPRVSRDGRSLHYLRLYPPGTPAEAHSFVSIDISGSDLHSAESGVGREGVLFAVWVLMHKKGAMPLIELSGAGGSICAHVWMFNTADKLYLNPIPSTNTYSKVVSPREGEWYHVAVTLSESTKSAKLYWNGGLVKEGSWSYSSKAIGEAKTIYLGHRYNNYKQWRANISVACFYLSSWKQLAQSAISEEEWIRRSRSC